MPTTPEVKTVYLNDLNIDTEFQRRIDWKRVERMSRDFNGDAVGVVTTSLRTDGKLYLIDGQHRTQAAIAAGRNRYEFEVQTRVFTGLSRSEEAELFLLLNNNEKVPAFDRFRARLVGGDQDALNLLTALNDAGYVLRHGAKSAGSFGAITALEWLYEGGIVGDYPNADGVADTLYVASRAFDRSAAGVGPNMIRGIGMFVTRHAELNLDRLIGKIKDYGTAQRIAAQAKSLFVPGNVKHVQANAIAAVLTDIYNKHLRNDERRVPAWQAVK